MIPRAVLTASMLAAAGCSSALSPEDPTDIGSWMELYGVPGVSIAVINEFELDYVEVHGVKSEFTLEPITKGTLFQAASLSKSVSAAGVMSFVQEGVVSLDANIGSGQRVAGFRARHPEEAAQPHGRNDGWRVPGLPLHRTGAHADADSER
jgi:CubicO group peptidase (beta-lactamase class C family)